MDAKAVVSVHDVPNLYHVPLMLLEQGVLQTIMNKLAIPMPAEDQPRNSILADWKHLVAKVL